MILILYTLLASVILSFVFPVAWILSLFGNTSIWRRFVPTVNMSGEGIPRIWIHAASVGESMIAFSMGAEIKRKHPDAQIYVSTTTVTGYERISGMKNESEETSVDEVFLAPFDHPFITKMFFRRIRPEIVFIVETEIWPWFILSAYKKEIPIVIVNGKLSIRSFRRYYAVRFALKKILSMITLVCVQSRSYGRRFHFLGVPRERIEVLGNVKFDGLPDRYEFDAASRRTRFGLPQEAHVFVAGSTRPGEEQVILRSFVRILESYPDTVLVCAPRHLKRVDEVESALKEANLAYVKRSSQEQFDASHSSVLVLDTMGELVDAFTCADVAFVGGSLRDFGGHNPMEPAALGVPVLFGPYMEQTGSKELLAGGAALLVHDEDEITEAVVRIFSESEVSRRMSEAGPAVVERFKGTLARTLRLMESRGIM